MASPNLEGYLRVQGFPAELANSPAVQSLWPQVVESAREFVRAANIDTIDNIHALQKALVTLGFLSDAEVDGVNGPITRDAFEQAKESEGTVALEATASGAENFRRQIQSAEPPSSVNAPQPVSPAQQMSALAPEPERISPRLDSRTGAGSPPPPVPPPLPIPRPTGQLAGPGVPPRVGPVGPGLGPEGALTAQAMGPAVGGPPPTILPIPQGGGVPASVPASLPVPGGQQAILRLPHSPPVPIPRPPPLQGPPAPTLGQSLAADFQGAMRGDSPDASVLAVDALGGPAGPFVVGGEGGAPTVPVSPLSGDPVGLEISPDPVGRAQQVAQQTDLAGTDDLGGVVSGVREGIQSFLDDPLVQLGGRVLGRPGGMIDLGDALVRGAQPEEEALDPEVVAQTNRALEEFDQVLAGGGPPSLGGGATTSGAPTTGDPLAATANLASETVTSIRPGQKLLEMDIGRVMELPTPPDEPDVDLSEYYREVEQGSPEERTEEERRSALLSSLLLGFGRGISRGVNADNVGQLLLSAAGGGLEGLGQGRLREDDIGLSQDREERVVRRERARAAFRRAQLDQARKSRNALRQYEAEVKNMAARQPETSLLPDGSIQQVVTLDDGTQRLQVLSTDLQMSRMKSALDAVRLKHNLALRRDRVKALMDRDEDRTFNVNTIEIPASRSGDALGNLQNMVALVATHGDDLAEMMREMERLEPGWEERVAEEYQDHVQRFGPLTGEGGREDSTIFQLQKLVSGAWQYPEMRLKLLELLQNRQRLGE